MSMNDYTATHRYLENNVKWMRHWAKRAEQLAHEGEQAREQYINEQMARGVDREMPTRRIDAIQMWETDHMALYYAAMETWAHRKWKSYSLAVLAEKAVLEMGTRLDLTPETAED